MTPTERIAATLLKVIGWVVALGSGAFMLLYLYRWEWNRALICGLFFVASEWRWSPRRSCDGCAGSSSASTPSMMSPCALRPRIRSPPKSLGRDPSHG